MFERFTERARQVVTLAQQAARETCVPNITCVHILVGLYEEEAGVASRVLRGFVELSDADITTLKLNERKRQDVPDDAKPTSGQIPFTDECKKALELALREALSLGHNYIGTEHLLLGLIRSGAYNAETVAVRGALGDYEKLHDEIIRVLSGPGGRRRSTSQTPPPERAESPEAVTAFTAAARELLSATTKMVAAAGDAIVEKIDQPKTYEGAWVRKVVADTLAKNDPMHNFSLAPGETAGEWVNRITDEIMEALG